MMKIKILGVAFAAALLLLASQSAKADSITDAGITYTLTQVGPGQVDLTVNTTGATNTTPELTSFSIQFPGATVSIDAATSSSNIGTWTFIGNNPNNPDVPGSTTACNTSSGGAGNPFRCFEGGPLPVGGSGDTYTFEFDVTGSVPTTSHIQFFQGTSLAISDDIGVGTGTGSNVPEPSSLSMLGLGALGLLGYARKRLAA